MAFNFFLSASMVVEKKVYFLSLDHTFVLLIDIVSGIIQILSLHTPFFLFHLLGFSRLWEM